MLGKQRSSPTSLISDCLRIGKHANGIKQPNNGRTPRWHNGQPKQTPGTASTPSPRRTNPSSAHSNPSSLAVDGTGYVWLNSHSWLVKPWFFSRRARKSARNWPREFTHPSLRPIPKVGIGSSYRARAEFSGHLESKTEWLKLTFLSLSAHAATEHHTQQGCAAHEQCPCRWFRNRSEIGSS